MTPGAHQSWLCGSVIRIRLGCCREARSSLARIGAGPTSNYNGRDEIGMSCPKVDAPFDMVNEERELLTFHMWKVIAMEHAEVTGAGAISLSLGTFSTLTQRYTQPLYAFLRGLVGDSELARDLLQDVFCAAWDTAQRGTPPFVADGDLIAMRRWLYRVAYRRVIETWRRRQVIRWESLDALQADEADHADPADPAASFEDVLAESEAMGRALAVLPMEDVACLLLMVVQGFTAREAAAAVGSTPTAMSKRVGRAKQRLLTVYQAQNPSGSSATPKGRI